MEAQAPDSTSRAMPPHHRSLPQAKDGRRLSKMILDPIPTSINRARLEVVLSFWQALRRGVGGQKRPRIPKGGPRIPEGDPSPKSLPQTKDRSRQTRPSKLVTPGHRKSLRGSLDLNYFPAFLTPNRGFTVTAALSCKVQDNCSQQMCSFIR